jgi:uncharacterized protein YecA (UPF0149 family)
MGIFEKLGALFGSKDEGVPQARPGRNEPCWCGSGRKYKKCHEPEDDKKAAKTCAINCGPT